MFGIISTSEEEIFKGNSGLCTGLYCLQIKARCVSGGEHSKHLNFSEREVAGFKIG